MMYPWTLLSKTSQDDILAQLVENLASTLPAHTIMILSRDRQTGSYSGRIGGQRSAAPDSIHLDCADPVIARLRAGEAWVLQKNGRHGVVEGKDLASLSAVYFPLLVSGEIDHVLVLFGEALSASDSRLVGAYCRQTALALETLIMQGTLNRKLDRLSSLVSMVDNLAAEQNYRNLLQTLLDRSAELLLAEQGSIMMFEQETDVLLLEASRGTVKEGGQRLRVPKGVGIAGRVAELGEPILVENVENDPRIGKKNQATYKTTSFVSVPLKIDHRVVGVMNFADKMTGEFFDEVDLRLAQTCASHAAVALDRRQIYEQVERLKQQAITDHLTGLLNRGSLLNRLKEELSRSDRHMKMMSLVVLDIDGFKNINDTFGHAVGDVVLRKISSVMLNAVRSIDIVGRYGGDEFVIILPETDAYFAARMAERVRTDISGTRMVFETADNRVNNITVSIGIATFPLHGRNLEVLVEHADEALYRAKAGGKDRVVVY